MYFCLFNLIRGERKQGVIMRMSYVMTSQSNASQNVARHIQVNQ